MLNATDFYNVIKAAAMNAVEASQPCDFLFGKVISASPLKIYVDQKMTLTSSQLVLTRNVTDYDVDVSVDWNTEDANEHNHNIVGVNKITIHNGLKINDRVVLLKKKGGQKYLILDKVVNA